jgi:hypothetical protein
MLELENMWVGATPGQGRRQRRGVPARPPRSVQCRQAVPSLVPFLPAMPFISHFTVYCHVASDQIFFRKASSTTGICENKTHANKRSCRRDI